MVEELTRKCGCCGDNSNVVPKEYQGHNDIILYSEKDSKSIETKLFYEAFNIPPFKKSIEESGGAIRGEFYGVNNDFYYRLDRLIKNNYSFPEKITLSDLRKPLNFYDFKK
jgi:hypothetical protein